MSNYIIICYYLLIMLFFLPSAIASNTLTIPRYASIKFNEVNARTGPTEDCPIEWVFIKKNEPIEIIAEYDQWYKIRDINNEGGWVKSRTLSKKRIVVVNSHNITPLLKSPANYDNVIAQLSPNIRCDLYHCFNDWCQVNCQSYKGWVTKKLLWGVYFNE